MQLFRLCVPCRFTLDCAFDKEIDPLRHDICFRFYWLQIWAITLLEVWFFLS